MCCYVGIGHAGDLHDRQLPRGHLRTYTDRIIIYCENCSLSTHIVSRRFSDHPWSLTRSGVLWRVQYWCLNPNSGDTGTAFLKPQIPPSSLTLFPPFLFLRPSLPPSHRALPSLPLPFPGGLLKDDWVTPVTSKLTLLARVQPFPSRLSAAPLASGNLACLTVPGDYANAACNKPRGSTPPSGPTGISSPPPLCPP